MLVKFVPIRQASGEQDVSVTLIAPSWHTIKIVPEYPLAKSAQFSFRVLPLPGMGKDGWT
jgi:hypothetical protein